jgi:hypothetical protein
VLDWLGALVFVFEAASSFRSYENVELLELYSVAFEVVLASDTTASALGLA